MIDSFARIIAGALDLREPWFVDGARFDEDRREVHIFVGVRKDAEFTCPKCGAKTSRYGYEPSERIWRHGDCMFFPTMVHCRRPRVACPKCGVNQVSAPFERSHSRFTLLFEGYAMLLMADMPRRRVSEVLRCDEKSLASILSYWVGKAEGRRSLAEVAHLAVDETSFRRGHDYVTLVIDAWERAVVDMRPGRDGEAIAEFRRKLEARGGDAGKVRSVTCDMSKAFLPAISANFPNAVRVIDKFHVKKVALDALDEVRREEQRAAADRKTLFRGWRLFMKRRDTLDDEQSAALRTLSKAYPKTGRAARIVAALDGFYASGSVGEAEVAFGALCSWMRRCRLGPMKEAAATLMRHRAGILAHFTDRLTNAICEGINSMVQAAKRKARGFRTYEGFAAMIYLIAGKLQLDTPCPFSHFH